MGLIKKACQITCTVFSKHVKKEIVTIVDVEKKVKHSKLAEDIEKAIVDGKYSPPGSKDEVVSFSIDLQGCLCRNTACIVRNF